MSVVGFVLCPRVTGTVSKTVVRVGGCRVTRRVLTPFEAYLGISLVMGTGTGLIPTVTAVRSRLPSSLSGKRAFIKGVPRRNMIR